MSSSDDDKDAEHLLSRFQPHHRPSAISEPSASLSSIRQTETTPRRGGRPPKGSIIIDLVDSEGSRENHTPRRPRGRPKRIPVAQVESDDSENSQSVNNAIRRRRLHVGSPLNGSPGSSVDAPQSPQLQTDHSVVSHRTKHHVTSSTRQQSGATITSSRSRRSRAQVGNYYSNTNYPGYVSAFEGEEVARSEQPQPKPISRPSPPGAPPTSKKPKQSRFRTIYDADGIRVTRHGFTQLQDIPDLPQKLPYSPQLKASNYAQQFRDKRHISLLHVSFTEDELSAIIGLLSPHGVDPRLAEMSPADQVICIVQPMHISRLKQFFGKLHRMIQIEKALKKQGFDSLIAYHQATDSADPMIDKLCEEILSDRNALDQMSQLISQTGVFTKRSTADIGKFLEHARQGNIPTRPYYVVASQEELSVRKSEHRTSTMNRWSRPLSEQISLRKTYTWKGASNDILNLAWSPSGDMFAVGAAAQCDEHNMQYNRSNNLILGDFTHKNIKELPEHRLPYPVANQNNTHLYMSVTAVQWFDDALYTSSYDKTVKIWNVSSYAGATCQTTLRHWHKVQIMARSPSNPNLLATGTDSTLHLWHLNGANQTCLDLDYMAQRLTRNPRATKEADFTPSSLAWGLSPLTHDILVTGFSGKSYHEGDACREGLLAAWKVAQDSLVPVSLQPNAQNIFDIKSHPFLPWFATGSSVSTVGTNGTGKDIRSLVRIYEPCTKQRCAIEFDCPALDINDVSFCPVDRFHISASCTDGVTYVWDFRKPSEILHKLCHGEAINQLDEELTREQADVGVRVALWGKGSEEFITGGSDGVLRSWNILRATEDAHVRDIAVIEDEVMSGAFPPDKSTLLIGDAAGGIHVLEPGLASDPVEQLHYEISHEDELSACTDSGKAIGNMLLQTRQLIQHPLYGVGKGPAYQGPYAAWARPERTPKDLLAITPLIAEVQALQLDQGRSSLPVGDHTIGELRKTAEIRNRNPSQLKRKETSRDRPKKKHRAIDIINLCSDEEDDIKPVTARRKSSSSPIYIDLTGETGYEVPAPQQEADLSDEDAEDYWFPDSGAIDPNIRDSE